MPKDNQTIQSIDQEIIKLLDQRLAAMKQQNIAEINFQERQIALNYLRETPVQNLSPDNLQKIFSAIIDATYTDMQSQRIGFLGPEGSYTHQSAMDYFGESQMLTPILSIEGVFRELENNQLQYGVVPIENNTEGAVGVTLDSLGKSQNLQVVGENYLEIHHALATKSQDLSKITKIYSHPQAYNQCRQFLEQNSLINVNFIPAMSTAQAAKLAQDDVFASAICSKIAADLYDLPVIFNTIEDNTANRTRFFILSRNENPPTGDDKTSIYAQIDHTAGSLARFLQNFQDYGVNLTKIESRPMKTHDFKTNFYIDFEGHINDQNVQEAIKNSHNSEIKWLGSYAVWRDQNNLKEKNND